MSGEGTSASQNRVSNSASASAAGRQSDFANGSFMEPEISMQMMNEQKNDIILTDEMKEEYNDMNNDLKELRLTNHEKRISTKHMIIPGLELQVGSVDTIDSSGVIGAGLGAVGDTIKNIEIKQLRKEKSDNRKKNTCCDMEECKSAFMKGNLETMNKWSIYITVLPFLFDTTTDMAVTVQFYFMWQNQKNCNVTMLSLDAYLLFCLSVFFISFYRIIMCMYYFKNSGGLSYIEQCRRICASLFDVEIIFTTYLNYKLNAKRPSNPQRFIQVLEACVEAAPQAVIQTVYLWQAQKFLKFDILFRFVSFFLFFVFCFCFPFLHCGLHLFCC